MPQGKVEVEPTSIAMTLLLPNLDDRTWADLTAEGTALIPAYGPEWTDQNYSDPGITLIDLLAFITEMDIYQLNQISDQDRLKFLALVGVRPEPPVAARVVLKLVAGPKVTTNPVLPAGLQFEGVDFSGAKTTFQIRHEITVAAGELAALQVETATGYQNVTPVWRRRAVMHPFGTAPQPGSSFYLGLTSALPIGQPAQIFFTFAGGKSAIDERRRLLPQEKDSAHYCPTRTANPCQDNTVHYRTQNNKTDAPLKHYGVRTVWEYQASAGGVTRWAELDPSLGEVIDGTRAFTLDGSVTFRMPDTMQSSALGGVPTSYFYLRCRIDAGSYDAAPLLQDVAFNGIEAEQAIPAATSLTIDPAATIVYPPENPPKPNDLLTLSLTLNERSWITKLTFGGGSATDPQFRILDFQAPDAPVPGRLCFEGAFLGFGDGFPEQQVTMPEPPVVPSTVQLYSLEDTVWKQWKVRADLDTSTRKDSHAMLDSTLGTLTFGTGEKGRVPPLGCELFAIYNHTGAQAGNLASNTITALADNAHNHALLYNSTSGTDGWTTLEGELDSITNPLPATGGAAAESLAHAEGRADQLVESTDRAVTLADYERLARDTPGTQIARVTAIANMHPSFPCYKAPGMITVIVLPYLPQGKPAPTPGLLRTVAAYLRPKRVIGTRVDVVGPTYLTVAVQASVQSDKGTNKSTLRQAIVAAINKFFDPIQGGPDGNGWPFGRDVYRSELMKVIDSVPGVDFIVSLALLSDCGTPLCGNVCLGPTWLVEAGTHQITVL